MSWKATILVAVLAVLCVVHSRAATRPTVHSCAEIDSLQKIEQRSVVVFIHTDWCRYCMAMERNTFRNSDVVKLLNEKFWFAKLNAEEKSPIVFNGRTFRYRPTGNNTGIHELAEYIGSVNGQISFPTICVLQPGGSIRARNNSYLSAGEMLKMLQGCL